MFTKKTFYLNLPLILSVIFAALLFFLATQRLLQPLFVNSDNPYFGLDFFTLPRCGLAIREGAPVWNAPQIQAQYGPWASLWGSHPAMCYVLGVPLSYLSPWTGYWLSNFLYFCLHIFILVSSWINSPLRSSFHFKSPNSSKTLFFYIILGFFLPWYVIYHQAQYHAISVLAMFLVLGNQNSLILGFVVSAFSKPFLAPASLVLLCSRRWKAILIIGTIVAIGTLLFFGTTLDQGKIIWGFNADFYEFTKFSQTAKYNAKRWAQLVSLALFFDEFFNPEVNYSIRLSFGLSSLFASQYALRKSPIQVRLIVAALFHMIVYAHGHEYHRALLVPILLYLYSQRGTLYQTHSFVLLSLVMALPSVYFVFRTYYQLPQDSSGQLMFDTNYYLYLLFAAHRPFSEIYLIGYIFYKELGLKTEDSNPRVVLSHPN